MWGGKTKYQLVCISLLIKNTCVRCLLVSFLDSGILDVVFICSSLQVAGEISCVFNHIAIFFFLNTIEKCLWLASVASLILLVGVHMLMSCN